MKAAVIFGEAAMSRSGPVRDSIAGAMFDAGMGWMRSLGEQLRSQGRFLGSWDVQVDDVLAQVRASFDDGKVSGVVGVQWDVQESWKGTKALSVIIEMTSNEIPREVYDSWRGEFSIKYTTKMIVPKVLKEAKRMRKDIAKRIPRG